jgi:hypothetical protein
MGLSSVQLWIIILSSANGKPKAFANDNPTPALTTNYEKGVPCCYILPIAKQQNAVCGLRFAIRKIE